MSPPSPRSRVHACSPLQSCQELSDGLLGPPKLPEWVDRLFPTLCTNHLPELGPYLLPPREIPYGSYPTTAGVSDTSSQADTLGVPPLRSPSVTPVVALLDQPEFWPFCDHCNTGCFLRAAGIEPHVAPVDHLVQRWGWLEKAKARSGKMSDMLAASKEDHRIDGETCLSDIEDLHAMDYLLEQGQATLKLHEATLLSLSSAIEVRSEDPVGNLDGPYHLELRKVEEFGRVFNPRRIPVPNPSIRASSMDNQRLKYKEHGILFDESRSTIILNSGTALLYVCPQGKLESKREILGASLKYGFLEVSLKHWLSNDIFYYGTFEFLDEWFPFTRATTGNLPELFAEEGYSKPDRIHFADLKIQWFNPNTNYRFCILRYLAFNEDYFRLLSADCAPNLPKRATCDDEPGGDDRDSYRRSRMKVEHDSS